MLSPGSQPQIHNAKRYASEQQKYDGQSDDCRHIIAVVHIDRLHELVRPNELAEQSTALHLRSIITEYGQCGTLERVLEERDVEQPVEHLVSIGQVNEESGKNEKGTDEKGSEDGAILEKKENKIFIYRIR